MNAMQDCQQLGLGITQVTLQCRKKPPKFVQNVVARHSFEAELHSLVQSQLNCMLVELITIDNISWHPCLEYAEL